MIERAGRYASLALDLAYQKLSHWARSPFLSESEKQQSFDAMEEAFADALCEGLGQLRGTATKLGQVLSMETGMVSERTRQRLQALQNTTPALRPPVIRKIIERDLGARPDDLFREFSPEAFASASLGQVHRAVLKTGEPVAIKILFPGVKQAVQTDFKLLRALLKPLPRNQLLLRTIDELQERILEETDYTRECQNMDWFRAKGSELMIPKSYPEFSKGDVLTCEMLNGTPLTEAQIENQDERNEIGQHIYDFFKRSVFEWGAIHADPHAGNYLWLQSERKLGLVDFGAVKREFDANVLTLFRSFFTELSIDETLALYVRLGADLDSLDQNARTAFYHEVVAPYRDTIAQLFAQKTYRFGKEDGVARSLRMSLVAHAFHPRLQDFTSEFTLLHRSFYGVLTLLSSLKAEVIFSHA